MARMRSHPAPREETEILLISAPHTTRGQEASHRPGHPSEWSSNRLFHARRRRSARPFRQFERLVDPSSLFGKVPVSRKTYYNARSEAMRALHAECWPHRSAPTGRRNGRRVSLLRLVVEGTCLHTLRLRSGWCVFATSRRVGFCGRQGLSRHEQQRPTRNARYAWRSTVGRDDELGSESTGPHG